MVVVQFLVVRLSASATYSMPALLDQGPNITFKKYPNHFCEGNFDADNHTLWEGICSNATCEERCVRIRCVCWDFQSASQLCRITNYTSAIQVSHSGFDAYVDSSHPVGRKICCLCNIYPQLKYFVYSCLILHYVIHRSHFSRPPARRYLLAERQDMVVKDNMLSLHFVTRTRA